MKRYRCPHCGWKTISYSDILASYGTSRGFGGTPKYYNYVECRQCGQCCTPIIVSSGITSLRCGTLLLILIPVILAGVYINRFFALLIFVYPFIDLLIATPARSLKRIKRRQLFPSPSGFDESPDGKFSVNDSRDIRSYGIYGIKFDCEKYDETLRELYIDGMVPVVFHEKKKGSNMFEVRIIGKKFVPKELLQPGSKFMVEDNDQFICRGQVEEMFPERAESDEQ